MGSKGYSPILFGRATCSFAWIRSVAMLASSKQRVVGVVSLVPCTWAPLEHLFWHCPAWPDRPSTPTTFLQQRFGWEPSSLSEQVAHQGLHHRGEVIAGLWRQRRNLDVYSALAFVLVGTRDLLRGPPACKTFQQLDARDSKELIAPGKAEIILAPLAFGNKPFSRLRQLDTKSKIVSLSARNNPIRNYQKGSSELTSNIAALPSFS